MNGAAVLWCLAHQSNFFKTTFTSLIKTTLGGIQQLQTTCGSTYPPRACFDSSVWIAIQVLVLFPLSNKQGFPFVNFPNILFLFEVHNSYTCTVFVYTYMDTHVHVYKYIHIYTWGLRSQFVKVQHTINPRCKHTSTHTEVQIKATLTNFLQLEMQFFSFFLDV